MGAPRPQLVALPLACHLDPSSFFGFSLVFLPWQPCPSLPTSRPPSTAVARGTSPHWAPPRSLCPPCRRPGTTTRLKPSRTSPPGQSEGVCPEAWGPPAALPAAVPGLAAGPAGSAPSGASASAKFQGLPYWQDKVHLGDRHLQSGDWVLSPGDKANTR